MTRRIVEQGGDPSVDIPGESSAGVAQSSDGIANGNLPPPTMPGKRDGIGNNGVDGCDDPPPKRRPLPWNMPDRTASDHLPDRPDGSLTRPRDGGGCCT